MKRGRGGSEGPGVRPHLPGAAQQASQGRRAGQGKLESKPAGGLPPRVDPVHPARAVLIELEELLTRERAALVALDRDAIEAHAAEKLVLDARLHEATASCPLGPSDKQLLEKVREAALSNQLLLAHARSCVQGVLSLLAPGNMPGYAGPGQAANNANLTPPPIALNVRR
jgi:hypothetical protein